VSDEVGRDQNAQSPYSRWGIWDLKKIKDGNESQIYVTSINLVTVWLDIDNITKISHSYWFRALPTLLTQLFGVLKKHDILGAPGWLSQSKGCLQLGSWSRSPGSESRMGLPLSLWQINKFFKKKKKTRCERQKFCHLKIKLSKNLQVETSLLCGRYRKKSHTLEQNGRGP